MSKNKELTEKEIALESFLDRLTDIELDTESETIFKVCETIRDVDLYLNETELLEKLIEWLANNSKEN